mmetsp:Transcript_7779/g.23015  ORF Transcript_7779/g.23015 Transcript_7779/m.23015 type:complete len:286 (-) Transcript_7779:455-1312(-)
MTSIGSDLPETTAPITVSTQGCLNFVIIRISRTKSRRIWEGPTTTRFDTSVTAVTLPVTVPVRQVPSEGRLPPFSKSPPRSSSEDFQLIIADNVRNLARPGLGQHLPLGRHESPRTSGAGPKASTGSKPPGSITRFTATSVPRYSARRTRPKVPRPRTSWGSPKVSSVASTAHVASCHACERLKMQPTKSTMLTTRGTIATYINLDGHWDRPEKMLHGAHTPSACWYIPSPHVSQAGDHSGLAVPLVWRTILHAAVSSTSFMSLLVLPKYMMLYTAAKNSALTAS